MTEDEAEGVTLLERRLTDWLRQQPVSVEWSLMALGISAARLIYGVGEIEGRQAGMQAARLLDHSVFRALHLFRRKTAKTSALH